MSMQYDPAVLQQCAWRLYLRANLKIFVWTLLGAISGCLVNYGLAEFENWYHGGKGTFVLDGVVIIMFAIPFFICTGIGYWIGFEKALWIKLRAQEALCQMQIEANTRQLASPKVHPDPKSDPA